MNKMLTTPTIEVGEFNKNKMFVKIEGLNLFGSMKDRAGKYVIEKLLNEKTINQETLIVESSSGNMAVSLAMTCKAYGLKFCAVIDPSISPINEFLIRQSGADVVKVSVPDENNSYLKNRLNTVQEIIGKNSNSYWFNQYGNPLVREAYCNTLGKEILEQNPDVDYIFMAVSSLGTIAGVCEAVKKFNSKAQVIAVDIEGTKIFNPNTLAKKHIPGIGSSIKGKHFEHIKIDGNIIVSEDVIVKNCYSLLKDYGLFIGGSSGACYAGAKQYMRENNIEGKKAVCVFADRGERYFDTIYNDEWLKENIKEGV